MELGKFENSRTFFSLKGNQKVVRDTFVNQTSSPTEQPKEKIKQEEPQIEVKMSGEPSLEDIQTEVSASKKTRIKKTNDEA